MSCAKAMKISAVIVMVVFVGMYSVIQLSLGNGSPF